MIRRRFTSLVSSPSFFSPPLALVSSLRLHSTQQQQQQQQRVVVGVPEDATGSTDDAIGASFGMQQSIRPSWSFTAADILASKPPSADDDKENASAEAASPVMDLPELRKTTEAFEITKEAAEGKEELAQLLREDEAKKELAEEIKRGALPTTSPDEDFVLEFQRYYYKNHSQVGAYIGSTPDGEEKRKKAFGGNGLALRQRREIERLPKWEPPYEATETSFRRLPHGIQLPNERELRAAYPMKTELPIQWKDADCADMNLVDLEADAEPIKYGMLTPKDYDPRKEYPVMVWLSDRRGEHVDFEDCCAHLFARGPHYDSWYENGWVILSPVISMKNSQIHPQEGVVARFCDWVCENMRVENNKVHLAGKGLGGFAALRTVLEMKSVAISCTALLGRMAGPYRPMERPQEKAHNVNGTHILMYVPGDMRKTDYVYKFKGFCDLAKVRPPVRAVHFAEVRDHQVYYAVNPAEFWNYMEFFRRNNLHQPMVL